jgi:hypothetical protein
VPAARTLDHPLASERLGLTVVQNRHAIGVAEVVSCADASSKYRWSLT